MSARALRSAPPGRLVVQQTFPDPRPSTNPYIVMLRDAISAEPGIELRTFSWRRALLGRYDVLHAHWPEILVGGGSPLKAIVRQALTAALIARLRVTRTAVVRTAHNVGLPDGLTRIQRTLLTELDRLTAVRILLNADTPVPAGQQGMVIPHGHYRDWFSAHPRAARREGRLAFFGLIRRYKGVEQLLASFAQMTDDTLTLEVAGRPSSDALASDLRQLAARDPRVALRLEFLPDEELVGVATSAELVVLPYRFMHNSGGALAALSLGVPVLLPRTPTNEALAREVGPGWVHQYEGELDADSLAAALAAARSTPRAEEPDLTTRDWGRAGRDHVAAYRLAVSRRDQSVRRYSR